MGKRGRDYYRNGSPEGIPGHIYLIHFEAPFKHAKHYLGWATSVSARLHRHKTNRGSRLMAAVIRAGIPWKVVRTWWGTRTEERRRHTRGHASLVCPVCLGQIAYNEVKVKKSYKKNYSWDGLK